MKRFDLRDPLPRGVTVLEASAGTGKTHTISALAVRFLTENVVDASGLLLVTFSRAATAELRTRVRERVRSSADALAAAVGGIQPVDELDAWLARVEPPELVSRVERLRNAVTNFDRATIMTTHQFSHAMIRGLGVLAPQEPQSQLVETLTPLAHEAASDLFLRRYARSGEHPPMRFLDASWGRHRPIGARTLAAEVVGRPGRLAPESAGGEAGERVAFAAAVREEVERRKSALRVFSFQDQLDRLESALEDPKTGALYGRSSPQGSRWCWWTSSRTPTRSSGASCETAFGSGSGATRDRRPETGHLQVPARTSTPTPPRPRADSATTLTVNHRSDKPVVDAVGALFDGVKLTTPSRFRRLTPQTSGPVWYPAANGRRAADPASIRRGSPTLWNITGSPRTWSVVGTLLSADAPCGTRTARSPQKTSRSWSVRTGTAGSRERSSARGDTGVVRGGGQRLDSGGQ